MIACLGDDEIICDQLETGVIGVKTEITFVEGMSRLTV